MISNDITYRDSYKIDTDSSRTRMTSYTCRFISTKMVIKQKLKFHNLLDSRANDEYSSINNNNSFIGEIESLQSDYICKVTKDSNYIFIVNSGFFNVYKILASINLNDSIKYTDNIINKGIIDLDCSTDSRYLILAYKDYFELYSLSKSGKLLYYKTFNFYIDKIVFNHESNKFFTSQNLSLVEYSINNFKVKHRFTYTRSSIYDYVYNLKINSLSISHDSQFLVATSNIQEISLYSVSDEFNFKYMATFPGVVDAYITTENKSIIAISNDKIRLYINTGHYLTLSKEYISYGLNTLLLTPDSNFCCTGNSFGEFMMYRVAPEGLEYIESSINNWISKSSNETGITYFAISNKYITFICNGEGGVHQMNLDYDFDITHRNLKAIMDCDPSRRIFRKDTDSYYNILSLLIIKDEPNLFDEYLQKHPDSILLYPDGPSDVLNHYKSQIKNPNYYAMRIYSVLLDTINKKTIPFLHRIFDNLFPFFLNYEKTLGLLKDVVKFSNVYSEDDINLYTRYVDLKRKHRLQMIKNNDKEYIELEESIDKQMVKEFDRYNILVNKEKHHKLAISEVKEKMKIQSKMLKNFNYLLLPEILLTYFENLKNNDFGDKLIDMLLNTENKQILNQLPVILTYIYPVYPDIVRDNRLILAMLNRENCRYILPKVLEASFKVHPEIVTENLLLDLINSNNVSEELIQCLTNGYKNYPEAVVTFFSTLRMQKVSSEYRYRDYSGSLSETLFTFHSEDNAYPWSVFEDPKGKLVDYYIYPLPYMVDLKVLQVLKKDNHTRIMNNKGIRMIIDSLWNKLYIRYFIYKLVMFLIILIVNYVYIYLVNLNQPSLEFSIWSVAFVTIIIKFIIKYLNEVLTYGLNSLDHWMTLELLLNTSNLLLFICGSWVNWGHYINNGWITDMAKSPLIYEIIRDTSILSVILGVVLLMQILRGFSHISYLIRALIRNSMETRYFLFVMTICIMSFGMIFWILFPKEYLSNAEYISNTNPYQSLENYEKSERLENYETIMHSWISIFKMAFGDFDVSYLEDSYNQNLGIMVFFLVNLMITIVMMNTLIAILDDAYQKVQENRLSFKHKERLSLLIDFLKVMPANEQTQLKQECKWLKMIAPQGKFKEFYDLAGEEEQEWEGYVKSIKSEIRYEYVRIVEGFEEGKDRHNLLDAKVDHLMNRVVQMDERIVKMDEMNAKRAKWSKYEYVYN